MWETGERVLPLLFPIVDLYGLNKSPLLYLMSWRSILHVVFKYNIFEDNMQTCNANFVDSIILSFQDCKYVSLQQRIGAVLRAFARIG